MPKTQLNNQVLPIPDEAILTHPRVTYLECGLCKRSFAADQARNLCECGGPLLGRFDLEWLRQRWSRDSLEHAPSSMWRYAPALPVRQVRSIVSLGEGMTPLLAIPRTGTRIGASDLLLKDEGEPNRIVQGARAILCRIDVRRVGDPATGDPIGWQRG